MKVFYNFSNSSLKVTPGYILRPTATAAVYLRLLCSFSLNEKKTARPKTFFSSGNPDSPRDDMYRINHLSDTLESIQIN